jgi:hypothetical protein
MKNRLFGSVGILWGGFIVLKWLLSASSTASSEYQSGQNGAAIFGALLFVVGVVTFFKKPKTIPDK